MIPVFEVTQFGSRAVIIMGGDEVWGPGKIALAEQKRDVLEREARRKSRNCMTCREEFMSEGSHHRMCARCRVGDADIFDGAGLCCTNRPEVGLPLTPDGLILG